MKSKYVFIIMENRFIKKQAIRNSQIDGWG